LSDSNQQENAPRRTAAWLKKLLLAAGIPLGALACLGAVFAVLNSGPARPSGDGLFSIDRGENLGGISRRLQEQGYIRFAPMLDAIARLSGTQSVIKAGYYRIPTRATVLAIHTLLTAGATNLTKVTIPEGWTARKIALHLEALGVSPAADFLAAVRSPVLLTRYGVPGKSLEGYLFPDTYFVPVPFTGAAMAELMVKTFFDTMGSIEPEWKGFKADEVHDTIVMASIVEREYRADDEAPLIASVFYNRLKRNIGLESCATLEYIITEIQNKAHPEYITLDDEKIDSPYNTYKWAGLPPGPISNPGKIALEAAFHPARTGYLYFVLRDQQAGRHFFSRDLNAHNQAKYLYLKKL
jgi:UPF0755 protein